MILSDQCSCHLLFPWHSERSPFHPALAILYSFLATVKLYCHLGHVLLMWQAVALMCEWCVFVEKLLYLRPLGVLKDETTQWSQFVVWNAVLCNWATAFLQLDHLAHRKSLWGVEAPAPVRDVGLRHFRFGGISVFPKSLALTQSQFSCPVSGFPVYFGYFLFCQPSPECIADLFSSIGVSKWSFKPVRATEYFFSMFYVEFPFLPVETDCQKGVHFLCQSSLESI